MSFPEHIDASPTLLFGACTVLLLSLDSNVECARLLHFFLKKYLHSSPRRIYDFFLKDTLDVFALQLVHGHGLPHAIALDGRRCGQRNGMAWKPVQKSSNLQPNVFFSTSGQLVKTLGHCCRLPAHTSRYQLPFHPYLIFTPVSSEQSQKKKTNKILFRRTKRFFFLFSSLPHFHFPPLQGERNEVKIYRNDAGKADHPLQP